MKARISRYWRTVLYLTLLAVAVTAGIEFTGSAKSESNPSHGSETASRPIFTLRDLNNAFVDIAKTVTPSVVTVSTEKVLTLQENNVFGFPFSGDPFGDFFGNPQPRNRSQSPQRQFTQAGLGSGVIVSDDGYILTNNHVVAGADSIQVRLSDGRKFPAKVIGRDERTDVAVIKVNASGLAAIKKGNSDSLQVGEMVMAIGSPLSENLAHTVTQGIVSAKGRQNVGLATYEDFIQTDAAINPGNSGGALVNLDGELVGLNSAIASQSGGFQGIGFAIPSNMAFKIMDQLISKGKVTRGWLGILPQDIDAKMAAAIKVKEGSGVLVGDVTPESPAEKAGFQSGDIITAIDGHTMASAAQLRTDIAETAPGTKVSVSIIRDGKDKDFDLTLGELPEQFASSGGTAQSRDLLGFAVSTLTRDLADKYGLDGRTEAVVVTDIDQNSGAYGAGLREGDMIRSVNHMTVTSLKEFDQATSGLKKGDTILLRVDRPSNGLFLAFTL